MLKFFIVTIALVELVVGKFYMIETKGKGNAVHGPDLHHEGKHSKAHSAWGEKIKKSSHSEPDKEYGGDYMDNSSGWGTKSNGAAGGWGQGQTVVGVPTTEKAVSKPVCEYTEWSDWKNSGVCGKTSKFRTRQCTRNNAEENCAFCEESTSESEEVTLGPCCMWSSWGSWSNPGDKCVDSTITRTRMCESSGVNAGSGECTDSACGSESSTETQTVKGEICCEWSSWSSGSCAVTCGSGTISKSRQCKNNNGQDCSECQGASTLIQPCSNLQPCQQEPAGWSGGNGGWGRRRR